MPKLPARRSNQPAGWILVPERENFSWVLRLAISPRSSVTVPVRVLTADRGWTQYFYADLDALSPSQLEGLIANDVLEALHEAA